MQPGGGNVNGWGEETVLFTVLGSSCNTSDFFHLFLGNQTGLTLIPPRFSKQNKPTLVCTSLPSVGCLLSPRVYTH